MGDDWCLMAEYGTLDLIVRHLTGVLTEDPELREDGAEPVR
jgi:hypothetical protein